MKKLSCLLFFLAILSIACNKNTESLEPQPVLSSFEKLMESQPYPIDQLSSEALLAFNESLTFDENQRIISADFQKVSEELEGETLQLFLQLVLGEEAEIFNSIEAAQMQAGDMADYRAECLFYVLHYFNGDTRCYPKVNALCGFCI